MLLKTDLEFYKKNNKNFVTPFAVIFQLFWSNINHISWFWCLEEMLWWGYIIKQGRHATNDASLMCENCGVGCGVGSDDSGGGSGGVDEIVAEGPEDVLKRYFPL